MDRVAGVGFMLITWMPYQSGKKVLMFYSDIYMLHLQYEGMTDVKLKFECNRIAVKPSAVKLTSTSSLPLYILIMSFWLRYTVMLKKTEHFIACFKSGIRHTHGRVRFFFHCWLRGNIAGFAICPSVFVSDEEVDLKGWVFLDFFFYSSYI